MKLISEANIYLKFCALMAFFVMAWFISNDMNHLFYARASALAILGYAALTIQHTFRYNSIIFYCTGVFIVILATFVSINAKGKIPYLMNTIKNEMFHTEVDKET